MKQGIESWDRIGESVDGIVESVDRIVESRDRQPKARLGGAGGAEARTAIHWSKQ